MYEDCIKKGVDLIGGFFNISLIYGVGFFLLRSLSFLLLPIYTNLLSVSDAGLIFIIYTLLAFLNPLFALGMDSALFKFYNLSQYDKKTIVSNSFLSLLLTSSFLSIVCITIISTSSIPFSKTIGIYSIIIVFFDSLSARSLVLIRLLEKPFYYLFVGLINILVSLGLNLLFLHFWSMGSFGAIYAMVGTAIIQFLCLFPAWLQYINVSVWNITIIKKMFAFGIPFLPSSLLLIVTGLSDRWLIGYYLDLKQVGLYGAGYKIGSIISIIVLAFNLSWQPYYLKHSEDKSFIKNINKISYMFCMLLLLLSTFISLFWPLILQINVFDHYLIGKSFWAGGNIVPWVAFGYFFYGLYVLQTPSIYICNKQKWSPLFWSLGALSNILINIILIPKIGILGAAVSTCFCYTIMFVSIFIKNQMWLKNNFIDSFLIFFALINALVVYLNEAFNFHFLVFCSFFFCCLLFFLKYQSMQNKQ